MRVFRASEFEKLYYCTYFEILSYFAFSKKKEKHYFCDIVLPDKFVRFYVNMYIEITAFPQFIYF